MNKNERLLAHVKEGGHVENILSNPNDLQECAQAMRTVQEELERVASVKSALQSAFDYLRTGKIPELLDEMGARSVTLEGIGRVGLTADAYVHVPSERRGELYEWLVGNGFSDLITETVNASTLKAWAMRRIKAGEDVPEVIKITPYSRASITKV